MAAAMELAHERARSQVQFEIQSEEEIESVSNDAYRPGKQRERSENFHQRTVSFQREDFRHRRKKSSHQENLARIAHLREKSSITQEAFFDFDEDDGYRNTLQFEDLNYIPEDLTFGLRRIFPESFDTAKHERFPSAIGYFDNGLGPIPEKFMQQKRVITLPGMVFIRELQLDVIVSNRREEIECFIWDKNKVEIMDIIGSFCFGPHDYISLALAYPFYKNRVLDAYFDNIIIDEAENLIIAFKDGSAFSYPGDIPLIEVSSSLLNALDQDGNPVRLFRNKVSNAFAALTMMGGVLTWGSRKHGGDSSKVFGAIHTGVYQLFATAYAFAALKKNFHVVCWGLPGYGGDCDDVVETLNQQGVVNIKSTHGAFAALTRKNACVVWGDPEYGGNAGKYAGELEKDISRVYASPSAFAIVKTNGTIIVLGQQSLNGCEDDSRATMIKSLKNIQTTSSGFVAMMRSGRTWFFEEA